MTARLTDTTVREIPGRVLWRPEDHRSRFIGRRRSHIGKDEHVEIDIVVTEYRVSNRGG